MTYHTGDTIRVRVTFRDWAPEGSTGSVVDPASVAVQIFDSTETRIASAVAEKESTGIYFYDWILPEEAGKYYIEFKGTLDGEPNIIRKDVSVKFKP